MADDSFEDQVRQFAKSTDGKQVNWSERKQWWQRQVLNLFDTFAEWLQPLVASGDVKLERKKIFINEEGLGRYQTQHCVVKIRDQTLSFKPKGSVIVGAFGRIDAIGPTGFVLLLLVPPSDARPDQARNNAAWTIAHPRDKRTLKPLDKQSFQQLFSDLLGIGDT